MIFLAGGACGWFLAPKGGTETDPRAGTSPSGAYSPGKTPASSGGAGDKRRPWRSGSAQERLEAFVSAFQIQLELDEEQANSLRSVVETGMRDYVRLDREHLRLRKEVHDRLVEEVSPILKPEQLERFEKLTAESEARHGRLRRQRLGTGE